jgi:hypothetical protein
VLSLLLRNLIINPKGYERQQKRVKRKWMKEAQEDTEKQKKAEAEAEEEGEER